MSPLSDTAVELAERALTSLLLRRPHLITANLEALHRDGRIPAVPTRFQVTAGVAYMVHRMLFRPETIGLAPEDVPVRSSWRARLLSHRAVRFPFLVRERAIHPLELTGLGTPPAALRHHALTAYHPRDHVVYDLVILSAHPGELERLRDEAAAIVDGTHPRAAYLRDLCVYEGYHEGVLAAVERALRGDFMSADLELASDATLEGYVDWLLSQPTGLRAWVEQVAGAA